MRAMHVITPGDHFSPSTGSAVPTVVDGLCRFADSREPRAQVAVAEGTYTDVYDSADVVRYPPASRLPGFVMRSGRYLDGVAGRLGLPRPVAGHVLRPIAREQKRWDPSMIFAHNLPQLVRLVGRSRHAPVLYAHNELLRSYSRAEAGRTLGAAHRIICVSQYLADVTSSRLPTALVDRVRVVRNGVDAPAFRRPTPLVRSEQLHVAFVGRMVAEKGADVLVDAVRRLGRDDIHLTLVGSRGFDAADPLGEYERSVRAAADALGNRVTVSPFVPRGQVIRLLQRSDVVVVPSRWPEPFALTVTEGMAAGAAVVGSDIGGIPESLRGIGILVRPGDPADLALALEALADDESLLRRTAAAGRRYAEDHDWSWSSRQLAAAVAC